MFKEIIYYNSNINKKFYAKILQFYKIDDFFYISSK
jgi:hypothetical protein